MRKYKINLTVNSIKYQREVAGADTLLDLLRGDLGLTGTKHGCGKGDCGACTVLLNGRAVNSCLVLAAQADGKEVTTIEGLATDDLLHPLQEAFIRSGAVQCGFCTPGMILSAKVLLDESPNPTKEDIHRSISGNLCRCTGYFQIMEAISDVAHSNFAIKEGGSDEAL